MNENTYGYDLQAVLQNGEIKKFHFVGSERKARYKTILKTGVKSILSAVPLTKEQWVNAYGDPRSRM